MAGISEAKAMAAKRQGAGLAKHMGYAPGSEKYNAAVYGTARAKGWKPSREVGKSKRKGPKARDVSAAMRSRKR